MKLWCWSHNATHPFAPGEVEEIVYALTGALADAGQTGPVEVHGDRLQFACPKEVLGWARDGEMFLEHVEQGVECRRAAA